MNQALYAHKNNKRKMKKKKKGLLSESHSFSIQGSPTQLVICHEINGGSWKLHTIQFLLYILLSPL
jgi:hypothetical protein